MKPTIFFVEDDTSINALIEATLENNNFEVEGFLEPISFLKRIQNIAPDLIVLDLMLPNLSGHEVLRRLKDNKRTENIPVIILSAKSTEADIVKGLDMGASDYITKPFGLNEFISRINANLRKINMSKGKLLKVDNLTLDPIKHKLFYKDIEVQLRIKEFEIMQQLMETPNVVVTRQTLFKKVWGFDCDIETRTLDMHIKTIREKIKELTNLEYIDTIRGVGYVINELGDN